MTPVIDVHAHMFSARDIPIFGYLRSRESEALLEKLLSWLLVRPLARCLAKTPDTRGALCNVMLELLSAMMGGQYQEWARTLSYDGEDIAMELVDTFREIDLFVPLMIDYQYWFRALPEKRITDIKDQIAYVRDKIIVPFKGRIHPFVAFDPAREIAFRKELKRPDRSVEQHSSLQLVKDAIQEMGFIGVKLYNSLGYKPWNNAEVDRDRRRIWVHRLNGYLKHMTGDDYDQVLGELYEYCIAHGVPITTHCGIHGIEAYNDASWVFGKAAFWREVLDQSAYRNLRLNLGHFGWYFTTGYDGLDDKGRPSWVQDICQMLPDYPHLYADVSHHRVLDYPDRRRFKDEYAKMRQAAGTNWPQIKKKILFGIDWHVIKRVRGHPGFQDAYSQVVTEGAQYSPADLEDFLGGNAMRFLGLQPGDQNHQRLAAFYLKHDITPPPWFP
jgi:predicted TIM-barrel fold metal-dependent hydrolase